MFEASIDWFGGRNQLFSEVSFGEELLFHPV